MSFQELHILNLITSPSLADAVGFHATKFTAFFQRSLHEFALHNFIVSLPSHLPPPFQSLNEVRTPRTSNNDDDLRGIHRHRFCILPQMSMCFRYGWECEEPYGHHIQPDLTVADDDPSASILDRYQEFRAQGLALQVCDWASFHDSPVNTL